MGRRTGKVYKLGVFDHWSPSMPTEETDLLREKFRCIWTAILGRALSENIKKKSPTYKNVTVCKEWLLFSNFANWAFAEHCDGLDIDKDILSLSKKIYSPATCAFVPRYINVAATTVTKGDGQLPIGVSEYRRKVGLFYTARCTNFRNGRSGIKGVFETKEDAHRMWQEHRIIYLRDMVEYYSKQNYYRKDIAEVFKSFAEKINSDMAKGAETVSTFFTPEELSRRVG